MMLNGSTDSIRPVAEAALSGVERLYWEGSPNPMNAARRNLSRPLFGLFWTAMVYFMYTKFALSKSFAGDFSIIFKLILAAFFLVGIGMILSPAWNYIKARYTVYAITDERAMIISLLWQPPDERAMIIRRLPKQTVQSYSIRNMENIERHGSDREGSVVFGRETIIVTNRRAGGGSQTQTMVVPVGFFGIAQPREAERILLDIMQRAGERDALPSR